MNTENKVVITIVVIAIISISMYISWNGFLLHAFMKLIGYE
jgi:hypothetical protein